MNGKIILGTVQLGLSYGINNKTGKPSEQQAFDILDLGYASNISTLDSADVYGDAIKVIGDHKRKTNKQFRIINKFKVDGVSLADKLRGNLQMLQCDSLSCYMYHSFSDYNSGSVSKDLVLLKEKGLIDSTGVSVYTTEELGVVVKDPSIDVIQLPANIFDLQEDKETLLRKAKEMGKEIHVRSVFLQGLFLREPSTFTGNLVPMGKYVKKLGEICSASSVGIKEAALNFVLNRDYIDSVVLGIEHADQLRENLGLVRNDFDETPFRSFKIDLADRLLLNPANWKP